MIPSKNNPEPVYHYFCEGGPVVGAPSHIAISMTLDGLARLTALAKQGDQEALSGLHNIGCRIVEKLNADHSDYSASVLKWPVLLPQDRDARNAVTKKANEMRIGSVKAGGKGAGEKLSETSNKGFALKNLCRIGHARHLLKSSGYDGSYDHEMKGANGLFTGWYATEEFMKIVFHGTTGIDHSKVALLREIRSLPDYCQETRKEWVEVIARVLKAHPDMISEAIRSRSKTNRPATPKSNAKTKFRGSGSEVKKALTNGLENVAAIPGNFGDYVAD